MSDYFCDSFLGGEGGQVVMYPVKNLLARDSAHSFG